MRYLALLCMFVALVLFPVSAQADWFENFDSYALGSGLHGQGGWHGWDGNSAFNAYITDVESLSPPHSVEITGASDMVHEYTGYTTNQWTFTAWQFVPTGFSGATYFILLNTYADFGPYNWSTQVQFNSGGYIQNDATGQTMPLIRGRWVELRVEIDLISNTQSFFYDGVLFFTASWTEGLSGGGAFNIAAVDLYANGATPVYYDDMSLVCGGGSPAQETSWGAVKSLFR